MIRYYRVIAVSVNHNSFGLKGVVCIDKTGRAWEVGCSIAGLHPVPDVGTILTVEDDRFEALDYELIRQLASAPADVAAVVWHTDNWIPGRQSA